MRFSSGRPALLRLLLVKDQRRLPIVDALLAHSGDVRIEIEESSEQEPSFLRSARGLFDAVLVHLDGTRPFAAGRIERLRRSFAAPVLILTNTWSDSSSTEAIRHGAQDFIVIHQSNAQLLLRSIRLAIERHRIEEELREQTRQLLIAKEQLEKLVITDPLTSALNERGLERAIDDEPRLAKGRHSSAVLVECEDLALINERFGYKAGDRVLREIAKRIGGCLRKTDSISRVHGDRFLVLLPDTSEDAAQAIADRARTSVASRPIETHAGTVEVTVRARVHPLSPTILDEHCGTMTSDLPIVPSALPTTTAD